MQTGHNVRGNSQGVIVVDDDQMIRDILRASLVKLEQDVYLASNGLAGCGKKAFQNGFDTIQCGL
jgi:CheY-like chemotaxis protein